VQEIQQENQGDGTKANQIAAIFFRRKGRGRYPNSAFKSGTSTPNRGGRRRTSSDDGTNLRRSRSRSINT